MSGSPLAAATAAASSRLPSSVVRRVHHVDGEGRRGERGKWGAMKKPEFPLKSYAERAGDVDGRLARCSAQRQVLLAARERRRRLARARALSIAPRRILEREC